VYKRTITPPLSALFITLHSLKIMESLDNRFTSQVDKTMGLASFRASAPLVLRNGELLGHSPIHNIP
jgi:hypothetical protein